jgi:hypothetical protein
VLFRAHRNQDSVFAYQANILKRGKESQNTRPCKKSIASQKIADLLAKPMADQTVFNNYEAIFKDKTDFFHSLKS